MPAIIGRKVGMTQIFAEDGARCGRGRKGLGTHADALRTLPGEKENFLCHSLLRLPLCLAMIETEIDRLCEFHEIFFCHVWEN